MMMFILLVIFVKFENKFNQKEFFKKKIIFFFKELNKFNLILIFFKFLKFI